jgi:hypothetical protein
MITEETTKNQARKKWLFLLIPLAFLIIASTAISLKGFFLKGDINISVSEDDDELQVSARFPPEKTRAVHEYLRSQFDFSDLDDLNSVMIKKYQTPDDLMTVSIKSRPGYFKIVLDKHRNSREAYQKLKAASEGIKQIFTQPEHKSLSYEPLIYLRLFFISLT